MVKYQDELVKLRAEYNKQLKAAANDEQRSRINQKFAVQQMDMQRELYQQIINSNLQAIDDMQKKLKTEDLTTEQRQTLKESIFILKSFLDNIFNVVLSVNIIFFILCNTFF